MSIYETINQISTDARITISVVGLGAVCAGMIGYVAVKLYKNTKETNAQLDQIDNIDKDKLSKLELLSLYGNVESFLRQKVLGKRREQAERIGKEFEERIAKYEYSGQEVLDFAGQMSANYRDAISRAR